MQKKYIGLYAKDLSGHRKEYQNFIKEFIPAKTISLRELFFKREPVIFMMIEDSPLIYLFISIFRALFKFQSIGFLFRPLPVFNKKSLRMRIKYFFLSNLKKINAVKTLIIIPSQVNDRFWEICDGWIYDMQLWDTSKEQILTFNNSKMEKNNPFLQMIKPLANGRSVISAIGSQNKSKGFHIFAKLFIENPDIRENFIFIFGGKLDGYSEILKEFIEVGGLAIDRFITNDELINLYASSDLVWSLYDNEYDQASGIFGRAVQFGIPSVIRHGSLIHKLCKMERIPSLALNPHEIDLQSLQRFTKLDEIKGERFKNNFKNISINNLKKLIDFN